MKFKEDIVASVKEDFKRRQEQRRSLELNWRLDMNFLIGNQYCFIENGDIVEILTSPTVKGPSRDWLKIVKTSQAKTKINQWLKKECREENIISGKELIEKECKRINVPSSALFREEWLSPIFRKYQFNSMDDLYASVGYGGLSAQKVVMRLNEEYTKLKKEEKSKEHEETEHQIKKSKRSNSNGINVIGIDNCLVRLAGCCNPVPGDDIIGFITLFPEYILTGTVWSFLSCSNPKHQEFLSLIITDLNPREIEGIDEVTFIQKILLNIIYFIRIYSCNRKNRPALSFLHSNDYISTILILNIIGKRTYGSDTLCRIPVFLIFNSAGFHFLS